MHALIAAKRTRCAGNGHEPGYSIASIRSVQVGPHDTGPPWSLDSGFVRRKPMTARMGDVVNASFRFPCR
jgi:hypothetical protein